MAKLQKPQKIKLDLLERDLYIHLREDTEQINQLGNRLQLEWEDYEHDLAGIFVVDDDGESHIIFNQELLNNKIIVHEAYHAAVHLLHDVGQEFDINNHEIYALLVEYLFSRIEAMFYGPSPKFQLA
jgi:hypothetical protein